VTVHGRIELRVRAVASGRVRRRKPADANEELHRVLKRVTHPGEGRRRRGFARRVERLDIEIAGREHGRYLAAMLTAVATNDDGGDKRRP
jgi:hypothetical protein